MMTIAGEGISFFIAALSFSSFELLWVKKIGNSLGLIPKSFGTPIQKASSLKPFLWLDRGLGGL
jgi:hypothetical protein